ncbi:MULTISPECIES: enoyl-CoA hydratase-related protein [Brevibacillus]|jgi:Enoyl-CoA hydratase/carnithine racemase|uniref:Enoyl-CoA hydratase n=1 Tax=Brevibacillus parabrevis TaxID=54914 RepID=A0A4Y3PI35_BREPA|nr:MULTISPECIES: enoyl-CoA hydratase-related protein [Brevibacillus]MBU8713826.1 enoyl-CoA hydratase/isomerase family protein [Brevibacillus parabrevis]MDH6350716.1 2-(1,2-epoxy-1,2-dihydrophenyl)acetyl-CoA isomerase [Brevibacillus sp. 1238]MDR4998236.1 enoyl-CoA hydratase-related protein [Brevibacillus parabrevis]MED1723153.1 enoyl-CoA hydratase-related protein [Brevibacillus parabrevis]MED2255385.1 enoyl-CoA hydratase-related protein [Brevibacillus parabrevis]
MYETILYEVSEGVAIVTLNRPDKFNAFTEVMHKEIIAALKQAQKDDAVRCILLTGAGRAFNAGQDLSEVSGGDVDFGGFLRERYNPMILQMHKTEKPIVAAVNGVAAGAGMSVALACDIRLASEKASFVNAFVGIGLVPDSGGCYFLPRIVGIGKALELAMTGEKVSAQEALGIGLVNQVYPAESFMEDALAYARKLAALPTRAIGLIKRAMYKGLEMGLEETLAYEAYAQEAAGSTADHKEGVAAFMEKRAPRFTGR